MDHRLLGPGRARHALRSKRRVNRLQQVSCRKSCRSRFDTGTIHQYTVEGKEKPALEWRHKQPASDIRLQQVQSIVRRVCATLSFQHTLASPGSLTDLGAEISKALSNVPSCSWRSVVSFVSVGHLASDMDKKPPRTVAQMTALIACILVGVFGLTRFGAGGPYTMKLSWVPIILGCFGAALGIIRRDVQRGLRLAVVVGVVLFVLYALAVAALLLTWKGPQS